MCKEGTLVKFKLFIDKNHEEEVIIYAHEKSDLIKEIEDLVSEKNSGIIGFIDREAVKVNLNEIYCFVTESNKLYAMCEKEKYFLKTRLYKIEENLNENFVKINQSCIANIRKIKKFDASVSGSLMVTFKNGYVDFVSRRNVKKVKERLGV